MNQGTAQAEDKCKNIDESNCKNSTLLNLLQKWKKLIDLKNKDDSRKGSFNLTSSSDPRQKRTSDPGLLLSKYNFVDKTSNERKISCPEKLSKPDMMDEIDTSIRENTDPLIDKCKSDQEDNETSRKDGPNNEDYKKWYMDTKESLAKELESRQVSDQRRKKFEVENEALKREVESLESSIQKAESDRHLKDHQIRLLNQDVLEKDNLIQRLTKEKKLTNQTIQKLHDDLHVLEDKNSNLNSSKMKLEQNLDELEDDLEREKRLKLEQDKQRKKVENDLRAIEENFDSVERSKSELEDVICRKNKELAALVEKLQDEQRLVAKRSKQIKECGSRIEELEEQFQSEKIYRTKLERQKCDMGQELEEISIRLEDSCTAMMTQVELNKRKDSELNRLKKDLQDCNDQKEVGYIHMKKKHAQEIAELNDIIATNSKTVQKLEKEKHYIQSEVIQIQQSADKTLSEKELAEKDRKQTLLSLNDTKLQLDGALRNLKDANISHKKLSDEKKKLILESDEKDLLVSQLGQQQFNLKKQLSSALQQVKDVTMESENVKRKFNNLYGDIRILKGTIEELEADKQSHIKELASLTKDYNNIKDRYDCDALPKIANLESTCAKLNIQVKETSDQLTQYKEKCASLQKSKEHSVNDINELNLELDRASQKTRILEKQVAHHDKVVLEWKTKADGLKVELHDSRRCQNDLSADLCNTRNSLADFKDQLEVAQGEKRKLSLHCDNISGQLGESEKRLKHMQQEKRRVESEKQELILALDEANSSLDEEQNKTRRANNATAQTRHEMDKLLKDKEDEIDNLKKGQQRIVETLQATIQSEESTNSEHVRTKKKLEESIREMELTLDRVSRENSDLHIKLKKQFSVCRDTQLKLEEGKDEIDRLQEEIYASNRKVNILSSQLEDSSHRCEKVERAKSCLELELKENKENLIKAAATQNELIVSKRKLETKVTSLEAELEESSRDQNDAEKNMKTLVENNTILGKELKVEKENSQKKDVILKKKDTTIKDLKIRLEETESNENRDLKIMRDQLQTQVLNLNTELESEKENRKGVCYNLKKTERKLKNIVCEQDELQKKIEYLQEENGRLEMASRALKQQVEDAEELASLNLVKYKKSRKDVEEVAERANHAEQALNKLKSRSMQRECSEKENL